MDLLTTSMEIAFRGHFGVANEKDGEPYILHVHRVATAVRNAGYDESYQALAWLHDVVEDTDYTHNQIGLLINPTGGVNDSALVSRGLVAITKVKNQRLEDYYWICKNDPYASVVKLYDILDNFGRNHRIADEETRLRLAKKYSLGIEILTRS